MASRRWQWRHACIAIADVHLVACDLLVAFLLIPVPKALQLQNGQAAHNSLLNGVSSKGVAEAQSQLPDSN